MPNTCYQVWRYLYNDQKTFEQKATQLLNYSTFPYLRSPLKNYHYECGSIRTRAANSQERFPEV
jgi:hypothetical protein